MSWVVSALHKLTRRKKKSTCTQINSSGSPEQDCLFHANALGDIGHRCNPIPPGSVCCLCILGVLEIVVELSAAQCSALPESGTETQVQSI